MKKALITGIAGQDGSYLAELLLSKGYEVHGLIRRSSNFDHPNIETFKNRVVFHHGDLGDSNNIRNIIYDVLPDEIYNLAAQSHVKVSYETPETTSDSNALGALRILEGIRSIRTTKDIKYYQASTSEMFGIVQGYPQNENTSFRPASPYAIAKLYAHWITINYRESYDIFACNGILFNHESPRRGELFVTRKITKAFANIVTGRQVHMELGNLDSLRDWGHAADYVEAMWQMLQHDKPDDYVISTGYQTSIRDFCEKTAGYFDIKLAWRGTGLAEQGYDALTGKTLIVINPHFYRPVDVVNLLGDSTKAHTELGWRPKRTLDDLVKEMCAHDLALVTK
jgi:GDPmannose 4,6-dehydratase